MTTPDDREPQPMVIVTDEFRRRVTEGMNRHWADPEKAARHRAAIKRPQSPETRAKKSAAARAMWARRRAAKR